MSLDPIILAVDTATAACSVAISHDGATHSEVQIGSNIHSAVLLEMVQNVISEAQLSVQDIDAVAVGQGPGSFTGLRIGVGAAQGIAYGIGAPMIGISSLEALAHEAIGFEAESIVAGIDARMGEIYWAEYRLKDHELLNVGDITVSGPERISVAGSCCVLVGNAWSEYWDQLPAAVLDIAHHKNEITYPNASVLLQLARAKYDQQNLVSAMDFKPVYVRNDVAKKSSKPLPGRRV